MNKTLVLFQWLVKKKKLYIFDRKGVLYERQGEEKVLNIS